MNKAQRKLTVAIIRQDVFWLRRILSQGITQEKLYKYLTELEDFFFRGVSPSPEARRFGLMLLQEDLNWEKAVFPVIRDATPLASPVVSAITPIVDKTWRDAIKELEHG